MMIWNYLKFYSSNIYFRPPSEKYKTLLVVLEKLYLAMVELGFSPTDGKYFSKFFLNNYYSTFVCRTSTNFT
jgi:hypothetical protein